MEVPQKSEIPNRWMVYVMENPTKIDDLGGTHLLGNIAGYQITPPQFLDEIPKEWWSRGPAHLSSSPPAGSSRDVNATFLDSPHLSEWQTMI